MSGGAAFEFLSGFIAMISIGLAPYDCCARNVSAAAPMTAETLLHILHLFEHFATSCTFPCICCLVSSKLINVFCVDIDVCRCHCRCSGVLEVLHRFELNVASQSFLTILPELPW